MCVCVSPPLRALITSHMKSTRNNWIMKFYGFSVSLYDTAIDNRIGTALVTLRVVNTIKED